MGKTEFSARLFSILREEAINGKTYDRAEFCSGAGYFKMTLTENVVADCVSGLEVGKIYRVTIEQE